MVPFNRQIPVSLNENPIRMKAVLVSLIEDEQLIRESLVGLIDNYPGLNIHTVAESVESFLENEEARSSQILLLDIGLKGGISGLEGIRPIKHMAPEIEIIMLTTFDDSDHVFKALCAGASAYLTKQSPFAKIVEAIEVVGQGGSYMSPEIARKVVNYFAPSQKRTNLTPRQQQIVQGVVDGLSYKLIADKLMISTETVRDHIKKIYRKLEINSKTELIKKQRDGQIV